MFAALERKKPVFDDFKKVTMKYRRAVRIKMCNHVNALYGYKQVEITIPSLILKTIQYERIKTV
ncbi:hypothetical protein GCM10022209_34060 [Chitinophaga oryziterrae]